MLGRGKRDAADKARSKAEKAREKAEEAARKAAEAAAEAERAAAEAAEAEAAENAAETPADGVSGTAAVSVKKKAAAGSLTKTRAAPKPSAGEEDGEEDAEDDDADAEEESSIEAGDDSGDEDGGDGGDESETTAANAAVRTQPSKKLTKFTKPADEDTGDTEGAEADAEDRHDLDEEDADHAEGAAEEPVRRRRLVGALGRLTPVAWLLVAVDLALVGGLVWLFLAMQGSQDEEKASKQVAFAATQSAEDLSSYDFRTIDADLKRATSHTTGKFRDDFAKMTTTVKPSATQGQIVVEGTAVKTAVESVDGDKAIALVYLNQQTAKGTTAQRTPNQYTMRMVMKKVGGRWLVSDLQMI